MSDRAFVIHATKDLNFVRQLRVDLSRFGIDAITSENIISPGAEFATQLERVIRRTPIVLLVLSKSTADRPWVTTEISLALSQQLSGEPKLLIPILAESAAEVPFFIKNLQFVDLSSLPRYREGIEKVAEAIRSWRGTDQSRKDGERKEAEQARLRLIDAERSALEKQRLNESIIRRERFALLTSAFTTLAGAVAALFTASTALGLLKFQWVSPNVVYGFIAGALAGGVVTFLVITWRNRSRDLFERRPQ